MDPFLGSEAIADGTLTRGDLRWNYEAILPNIYVPKGEPLSIYQRAHAAWLATGRNGIITGQAAAAIRGVCTINRSAPIEVIAKHRRPLPGIIIRNERIAADEVHTSDDGFRMTKPARTALDLGRFLPRDEAVTHLDALAAATRLSYATASELIDRYRGARGTPQARIALRLMDGGANSPDETRIRLWLIDAGLPAPRTQLVVCDDRRTAVIAMGWEEQKVAVAFERNDEASHLRTDLLILHQEVLQRLRWSEIRIMKHHPRQSVIFRVREALYGRRTR